MKPEQFTEEALEAISEANTLAKQLNHSQIDVEHLLSALLAQEGGGVQQIMQETSSDVRAAQQMLNTELERWPRVYGGSNPHLSPRMDKLLWQAQQEMQNVRDDFIGVEHLLLATFDIGDGAGQRILKAAGLSRNVVLKTLTSIRDIQHATDQNTAGKYQAVEKYGRNLTRLAAQKKLDLIIGRDEEIRRIIQVLTRRTRYNPVLIGEPGVGRTAIVEGLAQRIVNNHVPKMLDNKQVVMLDIVAIEAGVKFRGEYEERLKAVLKEVTSAAGNIVLFINELHTLVGAGASEGAMEASNMLKPVLAHGELHCIGTTTLDKYRMHIEKDSVLERCFQPIMIDPPTIEDTISILRGLKQRYEVHHGVRITDGALVAAAVLSDRYITDRLLPDKAIDLIDEAASHLRVELDSVPDEIDALDRRILQLQMEQLALKREKDAASRERLVKIEQEIANLTEQLYQFKLALESERSLVESLANLKKELEQKRGESERIWREIELEYAERGSANFEKVHLLKISIEQLEQRIQEAEAKSASFKSERWLRVEVTAEDVTEVVSKWTQIPISKMRDKGQKNTESRESLEIFFCYAREDELLLNELKAHLEALRRQGLVEMWYDRNISAGVEWSKAIDEHLNRAQIILLLISPDFIASDYCYDKEMMRALERHKIGEARVIPIILRPTDLKNSPFMALQAFPTNAKAVTTWKNRDEAFLDVAQGIRKFVEEITKDNFV